MKVFEVFRVKQCKGDVGVEIECEGENLVFVEDDVWKAVDDGSLRGAFPDSRAEYIFTRPIEHKYVRTALETLADLLKDSKLNFSYRTSVHVHINAVHLEMEELMSMMYAYYLAEGALSNYAGAERAGNNFCLRLKDAEGVLKTATSIFREPTKARMAWNADQIRYSAMNLESLRKYGSLEFRAMEGNMDVQRISDWVDMLLCLRAAGKTFGTPVDIAQYYAENGYAAFMEKLFGKLSRKLVYPAQEWESAEAFSLTIDLPNTYREAKEKAEETKKKRAEVKDYRVGDKLTLRQAEDLVGRNGRVDPLAARDREHPDQRYVVIIEADIPPGKLGFAPEEEELIFDKNIKVEW